MYRAASVARLHKLCARDSKRITIFEMLPRPGAPGGCGPFHALGAPGKRTALWNQRGHPVARVLSVTDGLVTYEREGTTHATRFDSVVNAVGSRSVKMIANALMGSGVPNTIIGDAVMPARMDKALREGYLAVMNMPK